MTRPPRRRPIPAGAHYQLETVRCSKPSCRCATGAGHGPYWFAYWTERTRRCKRYVGKVLPAARGQRAGAAAGRSKTPRRPRAEPPARVVVADPPWLFSDGLPGRARGAAKNYRCLALGALTTFPLPPIAPDAFLFLWYVTSMTDEARAVCRAWGFEPTGGELVWVKTTGGGKLVVDPLDTRRPPPTALGGHATKLHFGMGRTVRNADERCLIARRGSIAVASRSVRSVFFAPRGRHSEKPERFYALVEQLAGGGPYVELFARKRRAGWRAFGDELSPAQRREAAA